ncbi:hypothetical protein HK097_010136 [Rhizophlyctis rosea]|uniref:F-box domain-containing protein n=1 Tax=Rhizophlyctis rosea TaxID=64517 RepID=A0AAD5S9L2_9FUNG|nr:hypothetical protein HK097_010136 [Rhizophlyctis rosea]
MEAVCKSWSRIIRQGTPQIWQPKLVLAFPEECLPVLYGHETWRDLACIYYSWSRPFIIGAEAEEGSVSVISPTKPPAQDSKLQRDVVGWFSPSWAGIQHIESDGRKISGQAVQMNPTNNVWIPGTLKTSNILTFDRPTPLYNNSGQPVQCGGLRSERTSTVHSVHTVYDKHMQVLVRNLDQMHFKICGDTFALVTGPAAGTGRFNVYFIDLAAVRQAGQAVDALTIVSGDPHLTTDIGDLRNAFNESIFVEYQKGDKPKTHFFYGSFNGTPVKIHIYDFKNAEHLHTITLFASTGLRVWLDSRQGTGLDDGSLIVIQKSEKGAPTNIIDPKARAMRMYAPTGLGWGEQEGLFVVVRDYDMDQDGVRTGALGRDRVYWRKGGGALGSGLY